MQTYRSWIVAAGVIILVAVGFFWFSSKPASQQDVPASKVETKQQIISPLENPRSSQLEGVLKVSDNVERGNLMLVLAGRSVYLNTLRDFQKLVGKQVVVRIEGSIESFRLIDITAK